MSVPTIPDPAQLFMGILYSDEERYIDAMGLLIDHFGEIDFITKPRLFTETSYYEREMGSPIFRVYITFENFINQDEIVQIKLVTNRLEAQLSNEGKRCVNIDPGLLSEERLVLVTGKNYTHRIYLRDGIYADLTLIYRNGAYSPLPWTYRDYRNRELLHFLGVVRQKLMFRKTGRIPSKPYEIPQSW